ncbi:MAG: LysR family transcriptional regulator [Blastomonas sp.]|uniref:LysR family transcriptional regulator n=1 Tax=Blastomonas fulva TaxID=1550728 RepID=A0ABN5BBG3_9SPHN|nr:MULTISPECIES: LysR family transcriptional regulator [Blastomonas]ASR52999.1 LysR family transcriptional regulator [Blastomonas fulva]MCO5793064.1 LysR family transcriptional regulator [Blastomonas sp.]
MIERYLLRYFLAVVEHGNFTRAAESCNVTQPTLSVGIARLEESVGQRLFHRTNRRVDLTPNGAQFAEHARRIEAQFNLAEQAMQQRQPQAIVRLGLLSTLPSPVVAAIAQALGEIDGLRTEFVEGRASELTDRLDAARIDLAVTLEPQGRHRAQFQPVATEGYSLALPASHPLAARTLIAGHELADNVMLVRRHCEVLTATSQHFTARGVRPFFAARSRSDDRILALVAAGVGVTVMPDCFTAAGVARVPMEDFAHMRTLGVLMREADVVPEAVVARVRGVLAERIGGTW